MIAPDETTFAYLGAARMRRRAPQWERRVDAVAEAADRRRAQRTTVDIVLDAATICAARHLGHKPGQVVPIDGRVPDPADVRRSERARGGASGAASTWASQAGTPMRDIAVDTRLHRFVHERAHRGSARRGRGAHAAARSLAACARWWFRGRRR